MKKIALFTSKNLIGDGLYIQPALAAWAAEHPDWEIDLLTNDDHITTIYEGMEIPGMRLCWQPMRRSYDFEHVFDVSAAFSLGDREKIHITEAYARPLGIVIPNSPLPRVHFTPKKSQVEEGVVLLSMFSNSCASREGKPPNKMLSWAVWMAILTLVRQLGPVRFLGGPNDRAELLPMEESELMLGKSLDHIAETMRYAKLLITIDNGMGHLAATQGTPTVLFYPECLGRHWIIPSGNNKMVVCQIDPIKFNVLDGLLVVREGIKKLITKRENQHEEQAEKESGTDSKENREPEATGHEEVQKESGQEETASGPSSAGTSGILPGGHGDDGPGRGE